MKKASAILMALSMLILVMSSLAMAQEEAKKEAPAVHQYVGAAKCKICHNSEKKGAQFTKWQESKHSKAFEALASEAALKIGKDKGIENPQTSDACLKCHVTAFGMAADQKAESFDQTEGVGCEACHGPGSDYKKMSVMKDKDAAIAAGLIIPNEETCVKCHNEESPTYKEFNFAEFYKIIAHPDPALHEKTTD